MASRSSNRAAVPEAKGALDKFKYEVASELGVPLSDGYYCGRKEIVSYFFPASCRKRKSVQMNPTTEGEACGECESCKAFAEGRS